ncbi:MAG: acetate/propionate family kinase [Phycisphaeraceae bacterium]|nr:acetate/propionate family kinase [Phycisphaeraceae bacterium]
MSDNNIDCLEFLSTQVPLLEDWSVEQITNLHKLSRPVSFESHEAIIEYGDPGRFMGILLAGQAEMSVTNNAGQRHALAQLEPGGLFGQMAMMTGQPNMADVIGVTRCHALLIPSSVVTAELMVRPNTIQKLSRSITQNLMDLAYNEEGRDLAARAFSTGDDPYGLSLSSAEPMTILVINCGPSSLKYEVFNTQNPDLGVQGKIESPPRSDYQTAFAQMVTQLPSPETITLVSHRVVHGGAKFHGPVLITDQVLKEIETLSPLAPQYNPVNVMGIRVAMAQFPKANHVAVFDTAFHHTLPPYAYLYGLPYEAYENQGIRRYGFHGMSHAYVALKTAEVLQRSYNELEIVTCHLGNDASLCAVDHGRSVDTSMGFTPTEGLIMGTRCGNVDPGALIHLMRDASLDVNGLEDLVTRQSGLLGLSGLSHDMRDIEQAAEQGHARALLTIKTFCYHIRKTLGAYMAAMGGLDAITFTGGMGQHSTGVRSQACQGLACMGVILDETQNQRASALNEPCVISTPDSRVKVLVIPAHEERMMAREALRVLDQLHITHVIQQQEDLPIPIEISAHHVHLSQDHVEALFGPGHALTPATDLSQPGQFAARERVHLVGPKGRVERVRVLGPTRVSTQIEIAMTEQYKLGIEPPIRASGDLANTPGVTLEGPAGSVTLDQGVICAMRHIHMTPQDALSLGLRDKDWVRVRIEGDRELIFGDVLVRVNPKYKLAMHIDTDEGNAANIRTGMTGFIDAIQSRGH